MRTGSAKAAINLLRGPGEIWAPLQLEDVLTERPSWDEYGLSMAEAARSRADCTRRKVGAVLMLPDHSVVMSGYNGGPSGEASCLAGECPRGRLSHAQLRPDSAYDSGNGICIALHAEWNLLLRASWSQMRDSTVYITDEPCHLCRIIISGTPISRVVWPSGEYIQRGSYGDLAKEGQPLD